MDRKAKPPAFAFFPPSNLRLKLAPEEWEACLDDWIALAEIYLQLPAKAFQSAVENDGSGVISFITSYMHEKSESSNSTSWIVTGKAAALHKTCFLLCHRLLSSEAIPSAALIDCIFLAELCQVFPRGLGVRELLQSLWKRKGTHIESALLRLKIALIKDIDSRQNLKSLESRLRKLIALLHTCPQVAVLFITGSDLLDSLMGVFPSTSPQIQQSVTIFTYIGLVSLATTPKPNYSLLSDHIYTLKSNATSLKSTGQSSLLASIVSNTPFVKKLHTMSASGSESDQVSSALPPRDLSVGLLEFRTTSRNRPRNSKSRTAKGKSRISKEQDATEALNAVHVHQMSLISQIQDLFPELGSAFVAKLLDAYGDETELVISHLLENSLPTYLANADRSEQLQERSNTLDPAEIVSNLPPRSTPPAPARRNVFDDDDFDNLSLDASKLHIGRSNQNITTDDMLATKSSRSSKAAILAALVRFDADDDERDDTYDAADVGGTVDTSLDTDRDQPKQSEEDEKAERILYLLWKTRPSEFDRDVATRRSLTRAKLKTETGWTDEAIEGWALMLQREPGRARAMERKYSGWRGEQSLIQRTAWRGGEADDGDDGDGNSSSGPANGRRGAGRGRGRGRGRGGNTAGSPDDATTQRARKAKETKGGHNRREGHARKMARGM